MKDEVQMSRREYTRQQLAEKARLTDQDLAQVRQCRREHNRLGFAYQIGVVKLLNRFPTQQPFEILEELLIFAGIQLGQESSGRCRRDARCIAADQIRRIGFPVAEDQGQSQQAFGPGHDRAD